MSLARLWSFAHTQIFYQSETEETRNRDEEDACVTVHYHKILHSQKYKIVKLRDFNIVSFLQSRISVAFADQLQLQLNKLKRKPLLPLLISPPASLSKCKQTEPQLTVTSSHICTAEHCPPASPVSDMSPDVPSCEPHLFTYNALPAAAVWWH